MNSKLPLKIAKLEEEIDHKFQNQIFITKALTHSSTGAGQNYERLEFLGDRVLGLVVAELLFKTFPKEPEGDLAKRLAALVQGEFLAEIAAEINIGVYIMFSDAERISGGAENENILADVMEAVIGALYLDAGFKKCQVLIERLWKSHLHEMHEPPQHPKTILQEWAQSKSLPLPEYGIVGQSGPDHAPVFDVKLSVDGYGEVVAQGKSRQAAEKEAAEMFVQKIKQGS